MVGRHGRLSMNNFSLVVRPFQKQTLERLRQQKLVLEKLETVLDSRGGVLRSSATRPGGAAFSHVHLFETFGRLKF